MANSNCHHCVVNVYYHPNVECAKIWFANFVPSAALVPDDLKSVLLEAHKISFHSSF